jgi:hypothetical protein
VVDFPRPLDYALLNRSLTVRQGQSMQTSVQGSIALDDNERQWRFTPAVPWIPGMYELVIDPQLEDLAGNRIGRPFEVDLSVAPASRAGARTERGAVTVGFTVGTR